MIIKYIVSGLKWSILQFISLIVAFFFLLIGIALVGFSGGMATRIGLKSLGLIIFNLNFIPGILLMLISYTFFWFFIIRTEYKKANFSLLKILVFSLAPNIAFAFMLAYTLFYLPPSPPGCGFLSPGFPFFCLIYSLLLFPAYVYGLAKWVFVSDTSKLQNKRLLLLLLGLLALCLILVSISIGILGFDKFIYLVQER